jgi:uncharacterized protein YcgL (UPF0745 family)
MTDTNSQITPCWIYRSSKKDEMYLYLVNENDFSALPEALMKRFGNPLLVMELELHPDRYLAREDVSKVINNLKTLGYHLQMPPNLVPDLYDGETI